MTDLELLIETLTRLCEGIEALAERNTLILEALAEQEAEGDDTEPQVYMDGTPVR